MPTPIPGLYGGTAQTYYGFTRTVSFDTTVNSFVNGSEQRWATRPSLTRFTLPMELLNATDKTAWVALNSTAKGRLSQEITLTLGATTYSNLSLDSDAFTFTTSRPNLYDAVVNLRQTQNPGDTVPTVSNVYPTMSFGAVAEMPFTEAPSMFSNVVDMRSGVRYVWGFYDQGLTGFPTGPLRTWTIEYSVLSDADVSTLETFFRGNQGRVGAFFFADPVDSVTYPNVRFDQDDLTIKYITPDQSSCTVTLCQTFVS